MRGCGQPPRPRVPADPRTWDLRSSAAQCSYGGPGQPEVRRLWDPPGPEVGQRVPTLSGYPRLAAASPQRYSPGKGAAGPQLGRS